MLTINSRADKVLEGTHAGLFYLQVPVNQQIRTGEVRPGTYIQDSHGRALRVKSVSLSHKLLDPPIPVINLLVEEDADGES